MNTDELSWMRNMHQKDTSVPPVRVDGEPIYTIYLTDFFKMPDVDFAELAAFDQNVRALLN